MDRLIGNALEETSQALAAATGRRLEDVRAELEGLLRCAKSTHPVREFRQEYLDQLSDGATPRSADRTAGPG